MKGYLWGLGSVVLVTLAQLLLKWGVIQLPLTGLSGLNLQFFVDHRVPVCAVAGGLFGYVLSMLCWFFALRYLPLNRAYPLLSISYALVYLAAVTLPCFSETATLLKTIGAAVILLGVWLINSKSIK